MSKSHLLPIFSPLPVCFQKGEGVWLTDTQGNVYLDGFAGIAVNAVGHNHPRLVSALQKQVSELIHVSNYFRIDLQEEVAAKLCEKSGLRGCFFCNSGLEANEAAIKLARKYGHLKGFNEPKIIVFDHAFHGRSIATLSATGNPNVRRDFAPYLPDFIRVPAGDVELIEKLASTTPGICAVMFEPVQGEGGIIPIPDETMRAIRELCNRHEWLMILDEVQSGIGRTGKWFAYQHSGIVPDVMTLAKALGGGVTIDLIHEWDYLVDLFGVPETICNIRGKYSDLEIDSDDLSIYIAQYPTLLAEVHLDYFGRTYRRSIELFCKDGSCVADFGAGTLTLPNGAVEHYEEDVNERYLREMNYFLDYAAGEETESLNPPATALQVLKLTLGEQQ